MSSPDAGVLASFADVERALASYTEDFSWPTAFLPTAGGAASPGRPPLPRAILDDLEARAELCRRMSWLEREEAVVLVRWYVEGARPLAIAADLRCSVRRVYRLRQLAIERLVAMGATGDLTDAELSEFV